MEWNTSVAARTLWQEARGETLAGQQAVAHVLWNRLLDGRWGDTLAEVCLFRSQFSAWGPVSPGDPQMRKNFANSCRLADSDPSMVLFSGLLEKAQNEPDPTDGATHYYAKGITPPVWAASAHFCGQFGNQLFYKGVK